MARTFNAVQHPRDRFGRFTKSRTVKATAKDKAAAKRVADGFALKPVTDRKAYLEGLATPGKPGGLGKLTDVNKALRAGKDSPDTADFEQSMVALPDDVLLSRRVPLAVFGTTDPQALAGMKVRDAGFAPTQLGTVQAADGQVRMRIATPAGTRAAVDPSTGEVVLDRDTEMVVARVEPNPAGGVDMYLTVLPKAGVKPGPDVDTPEGADTVRADLMKLQVPALQAQMRQRGLKPGKMRKSQMVDALFADETGDSETPTGGQRLGKGDSAQQAIDKAMGVSGYEPSANVAPQYPASRPIVLRKPTVEPGVPASRKRLKAKPFTPGEQAALDNMAAGNWNKPGPAPATGVAALAAAPTGLRRDANKLTTAEAAGLTEYQDGTRPGYRGINGGLRSGRPVDADTQAAIDGIDTAMAGSPLGQDVVTYRGVRDASTMFGDRLNGDLTGMQWREDAFVSTAVEPGVVDAFAGRSGAAPARMRITVPAGTSAVDLSDPDDPTEPELLLDRGHTFEVVADRGVVDGVRQLDVTVRPKVNDGGPTDSTVPAADDPQDFDQRIDGAATNRKALDLAPLSLLHRSRTDPGLTPERASILKAYKRAEVSDINTALRDSGDISQVTAARIAALDDAVGASPLPSDVVLYRTAPTARDVFGDNAVGDLTGVELVDPQFVSLTASDKRAGDLTAGGGLLMRILTPAGTGAVALSAGADQEVLVGRGHTFRVVKDHGRKRGEPRRVDVELVPRGADQPDPFRVVESSETTANNPLDPAKVAALPNTPIGRGIASGIASSASLDAGEVGDVRLVTFNDGSKAIQKIAQRSFAGSSQTDLTDGEDLTARLGQAIGAPVPAVVRTGDHEVFMEYVDDARPGMSVLNRYTNLVERAGKFEEFIDSRDGRLIGVLDLISGNRDRHAGNWLVRKDGTITGIDHGLVWSPRDTEATNIRAKDPSFDSPFAGRLFGGAGAEVKGWRPNDLSPADVAWMRQQAEALRGDFDSLGRTDWLDYSLTRLDQLAEYAQGGKDRVRP